MNLKSFIFSFIIISAIAGCTGKPAPTETASDTLATEAPASIDETPKTIAVAAEADTSSVRTGNAYDSLEFNTSDGLLIHGNAKVDSTIKLFLPPFEMYYEPWISDGEELTGVFPERTTNDLTLYRLEPTSFKYNAELRHSVPPYPGDDESRWPAFYAKRIPLRDVKGKVIKQAFIEPGDSVTVSLGETGFTLYAEGKPEEQKQESGWVFSFVRNYRLTIRETSSRGTRQQLLIARKYMPLNGDEQPDFIYWAGDLNDDGFIDIVSGDAGKACATYFLWMGRQDLKFDLLTRFSGCGC